MSGYSVLLYLAVGCCWLPVIWLQIRMRGMTHARVRAVVLGGTASMLLLTGCVIHPGPVLQSLSGQVIDADTGRPITGAHLHFADRPEEEVVSSADGAFTLEAVRKWQTVVMGADLNGRRMLIVEAPSYEGLKVAVKLESSTSLTVRLHKVAK